MKKIYIIVSILIITLLIGCQNEKNYTDNNEKQINITTTIFPIYDITKEITKGIDNINVSLLMDKGIDLHNFTPSSKDLIDISNSDLFIYIGGESDKWVEDVSSTLEIDKSKNLNLMSCLSQNLKEEELKEGMEDTEEAEEEHDHEEEKEYDEHIWLSIKNAKMIADNINERTKKILHDENDIKRLGENYNNFIKDLIELESDYKKLIENARKNGKNMTLVFADRFPFRYFVDDYNLDYYAAFKGCSAESEASFKTIVFLANKIKELNLKYIFILEDSDRRIADTVIETSEVKNIEVLTLDSMQNKTKTDVDNGVSYVSVMRNNLQTLERYFE